MAQLTTTTKNKGRAGSNRMLANKANIIRYIYIGINILTVLGALGFLIFLVVTTQNVPNVEQKYKGTPGVIEDVGVEGLLPSLKSQLTTMMLLGIGAVSAPVCISTALGMWMSFANNTTISIIDTVWLFLMLAGAIVLTALSLSSKDKFVQFYLNSIVDQTILVYDGNTLYGNGSLRYNITPFTVYFNQFMVVNQCCGIESADDFNEILLQRYSSLTAIPMACCKLSSNANSTAAADLTPASLLDSTCPALPTADNSNMNTGCLSTIMSLGGSAFMTMTIIASAITGVYAIKLFFSGLVAYFTYDGEYDYVEVDLSSEGSTDDSSSSGSSDETSSSEDEKSNEKAGLLGGKSGTSKATTEEKIIVKGGAAAKSGAAAGGQKQRT